MDLMITMGPRSWNLDGAWVWCPVQITALGIGAGNYLPTTLPGVLPILAFPFLHDVAVNSK